MTVSESSAILTKTVVPILTPGGVNVILFLNSMVMMIFAWVSKFTFYGNKKCVGNNSSRQRLLTVT